MNKSHAKASTKAKVSPTTKTFMAKKTQKKHLMKNVKRSMATAAATKPAAPQQKTTPTPTPTETPLPAFSTNQLQFIPADVQEGGKLTMASVEQAEKISKMLQDGHSPNSFMSLLPTKSSQRIRNPELDRKGYNYFLATEGNKLGHEVAKMELPTQNVLVLPVSSKIGRKYVDDIRSGKVVEEMYKEITKTEGLQEVYTPDHTYVHWFRLHERNQRDFMKRLGLIETKLNQRFGSTYYLHVSKAIRKYRKRFTILRSPFVHKTAQDTYEYNHHEFLCRVSYAFAITDPEINDFIYDQLKTQVLASGGGISFGWDVKLSKPKVRKQQYTPLTSPLINKEGTNPDIQQIKYANYVGQQELLRQHCEANGIDYQKYAGDSNLFPLRDDLLRFRDRKLKLVNAGYTPSEAERQAFQETDVSELSDPTYSETSEEALGILKM